MGDTRRRSARGVAGVAVALIALASCGGGSGAIDLPAVEVGRSPHFRYYARAADRVPASVFDLLEWHWAMMSTFFGLDQNVVFNYSLFDSLRDLATHGPCPSTADGCQEGASVYTPQAFHEHELIHAYLSQLGSGPPIIAEGVASGLSCFEALSQPQAPPPDPSWQAAARQVHEDSTDFGQARLVRYLIRNHGPAAFASFYRDAEYTLDPATFAAQFDQFWGVSIESVWSQATAPQSTPNYLDVAMCPCPAEALPLDGTSVPVVEPYQYALPLPFSLSGAADLTVKLNGLGFTAIRSCWDQDYEADSLEQDYPGAPPTEALLRLATGHYYVQTLPLGTSPASVSIQSGSWFATSCGSGETLPVDASFAGKLEVSAPASQEYLQLSIAGTRSAILNSGDGPADLSLCPACDSLPADCLSTAPLTSVAVTMNGPYTITLAAGQQLSISFQ